MQVASFVVTFEYTGEQIWGYIGTQHSGEAPCNTPKKGLPVAWDRIDISTESDIKSSGEQTYLPHRQNKGWSTLSGKGFTGLSSPKKEVSILSPWHVDPIG
ncbi:MAG: hypothetical protein ACE5FU_12855 [Nitrospinota bacterium]